MGVGMKHAAALAALAGTVGLAATGCGSSGAGDAGGSAASGDRSGQQRTIYFSINFTGNAQRQQIIRTMKLATSTGPMAGKVDLKVSTSDNTIPAQAQDINNIVQRKPDAIVVIPSSESGLNAAIGRACAAGITVVAFDSPVTAPCAYNVGVDFASAAEPVGAWLAKQAGGKQGTLLVDQGIAGLPVADSIYDGFVKGIRSVDPKLKIVNFQGKFAPGPEKAAVANLLAAHRSDLIGVAAVSYITAIKSAISEAGLKPVPVAAMTALNGDTSSCLDRAAPCLMGATPMTEGAEAMKLAFDLLNGGADKSTRRVPLEAAYLTNDPAATTGSTKPEQIKDGVNAFPKLPPDLSLPFQTSWLKITAEQAAG